MPSGSVTTRVQLPIEAKPVDMIINDRWFNPTDTVARYECLYRLSLCRKTLGIKDNQWHSITIKWNNGKPAQVFVDDKKRMKLPLINASQHGPSYLHLLSGNTPDNIGILIESTTAKAQ